MKLKEVERLRAVAILMVLILHWGSCLQAFLPKVALSSWSGVDLFFVISGYVVTLSLLRLLPSLDEQKDLYAAFERAKDGLKTFYARRLFRILPAAIALFLIERALIAVYPPQFGTPDGLRDEAIAFFSGVYNYAFAYDHDYHLAILWSLAVEEHFYLLLPLLFVAFRTTSRRIGVSVVVALLSIFARSLGHPDGVDVGTYEKFSSHLRFDSLMAGVVLALVAGKSASSPILPRWLMRFFVLPACIVVVACMPAAVPDAVMMRQGFIALWLVSAILVGFAGLDQGYVLPVPGLARVLEYVGSRSYAMYLLHMVVWRLEESIGILAPSWRAFFPVDTPLPWRRALVLFGMLVVAAELLHRLVEKPFMRLGRRLVAREPRPESRVALRARVLAGVVAVLASLFLFRHAVLRALGPPDLALHKPVTATTQADDMPPPSALVNGELEAEYGAHTQEQASPSFTIDLGQPTKVGSVRVYNRADGYYEQQLPLELAVSDDGRDFTVIDRRTVMFTQAFAWRIRVHHEPVRYVRLQVPRNTPLCLSEVEVFEGQGMAWWP